MFRHITIKLAFFVLVLVTFLGAIYQPKLSNTQAEIISNSDFNIVFSASPTVEILSMPRSLESFTIAPLHGPNATTHFNVRATGYNSLASQTDSTPHITATGTRTRFGIIAVSRDLLSKDIPYGSLVRIHDLGSYYSGKNAGQYQDMLDAQLFIVEDTMHSRKRNQIDLWFPTLSQAAKWGVRQVEVEVVRYGRTGPILDYANEAPKLDVTPQFASR